jgi:hypothetical protein
MNLNPAQEPAGTTTGVHMDETTNPTAAAADIPTLNDKVEPLPDSLAVMPGLETPRTVVTESGVHPLDELEEEIKKLGSFVHAELAAVLDKLRAIW